MKHLPCIPDQIVDPEIRAAIYRLEQYVEIAVSQGRVMALLDPQEIAESYQGLLAIIDELAGAYLTVAHERDKYKGVCELASDDRFWQALALMGEEEEVKHGRQDTANT